MRWKTFRDRYDLTESDPGSHTRKKICHRIRQWINDYERRLEESKKSHYQYATTYSRKIVLSHKSHIRKLKQKLAYYEGRDLMPLD